MIVFPPNRRTAKEQGNILYFTGRACPHGHIAARYTSNAACQKCLEINHLLDAKRILKSESAPVKCGSCGEKYMGWRCVPCNRKWQAIWRDNPERREIARKKQIDRGNMARKFVRDYKNNTSCFDCRKLYPWYITEFDHIKGRNGRKTVSQLVGIGNISLIKEEIALCQLVCANCHKIRTHFRALEAGARKEID